jgi:hypothetical protein
MNGNPAQSAALRVGLVLVSLGVLGFLSGITTNESSITFAGHRSGADLIGVFQISTLHNLVHIVLGLAGVALARTGSGARRYLIGAGLVCLGRWALGVADAGTWLPVNAADDWLHLALGAGLVGLGFATSRSSRAPAA